MIQTNQQKNRHQRRCSRIHSPWACLYAPKYTHIICPCSVLGLASQNLCVPGYYLTLQTQHQLFIH
uniref:Uncharacterized protein n=1 Tax=Anguilla anguilla TaxID=7936 RepID=A0A0E9VM99_ANGAN